MLLLLLRWRLRLLCIARWRSLLWRLLLRRQLMGLLHGHWLLLLLLLQQGRCSDGRLAPLQPVAVPSWRSAVVITPDHFGRVGRRQETDLPPTIAQH